MLPQKRLTLEQAVSDLLLVPSTRLGYDAYTHQHSSPAVKYYGRYEAEGFLGPNPVKREKQIAVT